MIYVHLDSPYNSTIFTNCCNVAIQDHQANCPSCKEEVYPGREATTRQRDMNRWNWAYGRQRQERGRP
jgi:hypothetical protein